MACELYSDQNTEISFYEDLRNYIEDRLYFTEIVKKWVVTTDPKVCLSVGKGSGVFTQNSA